MSTGFAEIGIIQYTVRLHGDVSSVLRLRYLLTEI